MKEYCAVFGFGAHLIIKTTKKELKFPFTTRIF